MDFKQFVSKMSVDNKLPFDISFDLKPESTNAPTKKVAGFDLPVYNELLTRESFFFEQIAAVVSNQSADIRVELILLAQELKDRLSLERLQDAVQLIFGQVESTSDNYEELTEKLNSDEYSAFLIENKTRLRKLAESSELSGNNTLLLWLKITFFLLSRYSGEWTLGKTSALRPSQIKALDEFITLEANGGNEPDDVETLGEGDSEDTGKS